MMTNNLFVIANVRQLRTYVVLEFYCLFFRTSWGVGVLNSAIFNSFHNRVEFGTILKGLRNFGGGKVEHPKPLPLGTPQVTDDNIISCIRFACWINKATNTNSEYVILNGFYTATMVTQTRLNITFIVILPVLFPICFPSFFPYVFLLSFFPNAPYSPLSLFSVFSSSLSLKRWGRW